jgi:hypothetical protein
MLIYITQEHSAKLDAKTTGLDRKGRDAVSMQLVQEYYDFVNTLNGTDIWEQVCIWVWERYVLCCAVLCCVEKYILYCEVYIRYMIYLSTFMCASDPAGRPVGQPGRRHEAIYDSA